MLEGLAPGSFDVTLSDMYRTQVEEGTRAIEQSFAKQGMLGSGRMQKAVSDFTRKLTAEETERQYAREYQ